jgi:hypothetical protein
MAMHPKLSEGSIILYYPDIRETTYFPNQNNYRLSYSERWLKMPAFEFKVYALYVDNRRARTNGITVPAELEPILNMLKIKTKKWRPDSPTITAVGCYTKTIHQEFIVEEPNLSEQFRNAFQKAKELVQGIAGKDVFDSEFVEDFLAKKMKNKEKKIVLFTPIEQLGGYYTPKEIEPIPEDDVWPKRLDS